MNAQAHNKIPRCPLPSKVRYTVTHTLTLPVGSRRGVVHVLHGRRGTRTCHLLMLLYSFTKHTHELTSHSTTHGRRDARLPNPRNVPLVSIVCLYFSGSSLYRTITVGYAPSSTPLRSSKFFTALANFDRDFFRPEHDIVHRQIRPRLFSNLEASSSSSESSSPSPPDSLVTYL